MTHVLYIEIMNLLDINMKHIDYINSLDLYIVSHGGVGSNYIVRYLKSKGINTRYKGRLYAETCHYPYKIDTITPSIYICGDIKNALCSQFNKDFLLVNAKKMHQKDIKTLEHAIEMFPEDPIGIKKQFSNWEKATNNYILKYPYSKKDIQSILYKIGIDICIEDIQITPRNSYDITDPILEKIVATYIDFNI